MNKHLIVVLGLGVAAFATATGAQTEPTAPAHGNVPLYTFRFRDASLNMVALEYLNLLTGKNVVVDPGLAAFITASTPEKLTAEEALAFITQLLEEQGITLENLDEETIRVRGTPSRSVDPENTGSSYAARRLARTKAQREQDPLPDRKEAAP